MRYFLLAIIFISQFATAQLSTHNVEVERSNESVWVDSIYNSMSFDQRIGQLFMLAAYSNKDAAHTNAVEKIIRDYHIGGLLFLQGGPGRQARLTNRYQAASKIPLFIGIDAEWGLAMRLDSVARFPWNMTLGAVQDLKMIEKVGREYGKQSRRMGIHFNFSPVLDINTNPRNPIIGNRSFGEDKQNVTDRALALMNGIQLEGVHATGKHFPGHGDTETDSHHVLPMVNFSKERLNSIEFYPYRKLFQEGLASVMVAHLNVPALEPRENFPSSISYNVVTNVLQKELGFNGLIFTDALNMKGASDFKQAGEIDLEAFLAGNDILLFPENVPWAVEKICMAYQDSIITEERFAHSVKKILRYKHKIGLDKYVPIDTVNLYQDLNTIENNAFQYTLYENAVTVLKNEETILPIKDLHEKIAYVKLGDDIHSPFLSTLQKYTEVTEVSDSSLDTLLLKLRDYRTVIVGVHKADGAWKNHDLTTAEISKLDSIAKYNRVILDVFAKPYSMLPITGMGNIKGVVVSYQNTDVSQIVSAQLIFGAVEAKGKLPVSIYPFFKIGDGLWTEKINRLGFTAPENVGMNSKILGNIDILAAKAISGKMTPGLQVLVARKGKVIYQKSFGFHTYDNVTKVSNSDIYDVASLTKILSTLPNVMQMYDQGKVTMDSRLSTMLPMFRRSDKKNILFKDLMTHQARLQAWIPFYKETLDKDNQPSPEFYSKSFQNGYTTQVAENLYIQDSYRDKILNEIADSKLLPKKEYKYSDFTF
ncbi:MAG TPA: glycoside hydrolase family 3 N-terminal domain-containing protein, partial [Flavobacterium sp.]|nr:glycoside hydrolase family 3 N-terminal domain-containing protein [Flavobacterium sp.]